ncbi:hypothetical protein DFH07DRAFT_1063777 [Mycena maculata]|uniref:Uncharacterized protein n=1 Tax=Mycena maculata TaxID=230809 RepID=A0AAD7IGD2_9AGAR|nr:hypothetical protein DFH07DRAFT_1063777 [Mycena maculata]
MPSKHTADDQKLIDSLPIAVVTAFRSSIYNPVYITLNAHIFLDNDWIDPRQLRAFLERDTKHQSPDSRSQTPDTAPTRVKLEDDASTARLSPPEHVAAPIVDAPVKTRTLIEGNREVFQILSDSEGSDSEEGSGSARIGTESVTGARGSSPLPPSSDFLTETELGGESSDESEIVADLQKSDTAWLDQGLSSRVRLGPFRVTSNVTVQRVEYLTELASVYPTLETPTALVVDLRDPKFHIENKDGDLYTVDALIKNKDNDSWTGNTGTGDSKVFVTFTEGEEPILCRRSRLACKGAFACELVDEKLLDVVRRDLDPASRDAIFAAQRQTRREAGTTAERRVTDMIKVIRQQKCFAEKNGKKCAGLPILKTKKVVSRGHAFWVACSGWTKDFKENHRTWSIPDDVDEALFVKAFHGLPMAADDSKDTPPCSAIVHPHTGLRLSRCPHAHVENGKAVTSSIVHRACPAVRTIFVPLDASVRKALIIHPGNIAHNHPIPPLTKVSFELKKTYRKCIKAAGSVGATVTKVDNAPSTQLLLDGQTPGQFAPALQSNRAKRKLVREAKLEEYPAGLDAAGAFKLFWDDMKKPIDERYFQRLVAMPDGGVMMLTCLKSLMKLLDDSGVTSFETDTTFKRIKGEMNEWEVVIFLKALSRAVTIARAYVNGASAEFFERLYDEFQSLKQELTGKPIGFKRFIKGGNILAMNSDMEAAQVLGATRSVFKKLNDPAYSQIPNDTPAEEVAPEMIKLCTTHAKRAVLDFKGLISEDDYNRLLDFTSIDSEEKLEEFSQFVVSLGQKKIQGKYPIIFLHAALKNCPDWWDHKAMSAWILPCLIKSQSPMSAEDWDNTPSTTNIGQAQHHWTNQQTGIQQSWVEAMEGYVTLSVPHSVLTLASSARKVDERIAREIEISIQSGILVNSQNESSHRRARNTTRQSTTIRKSRESHELADERARIELEIEAQKQAQKEGAARLKELKELKSSTRKTSKSTGRSVGATSSSSGRVASRTVAGRSETQQPSTSTSTIPAPMLGLQGPVPTSASAFFMPPPTPGPPFFDLDVSIQGTAATSTSPLMPEVIPTSGYAWNAMHSQPFNIESPLAPFPGSNSVTNTDFGGFEFLFDSSLDTLDQFNSFNPDPFSSVYASTGQAGAPLFDFSHSTFSDDLPPLPPPPASSPPAHAPLVSAPAPSNKRKRRDEVDPANIIDAPRARKIPKRADA